MNGPYLGVDTSNYTTSTALYFPDAPAMRQNKRLLPVKEGELGLRQSDAVFHHTRQLPELLEGLLAAAGGPVRAIGVSEKPCEAEGSYMPCFLAGLGTARSLAAALRVPLHRFTHQQGHVAAAAYGAGCPELLKGDFLAFHVSGGTTDALLVRPDPDGGIRCTLAASSLDLRAGQLIDRVGKALGLPFPAGPALERLALEAPRPQNPPRPVLRGADCSLSGVENQCERLRRDGAPAPQVARFCLESVLAAVSGMTGALQRAYPGLPLLYAGGVMSNAFLREELSSRFGGRFAPPAFSADNAAGAALLCALREKGGRL
ncbi:MAG TPA: peptidase M22 [Firmicutes bacterium]|nr:peptidase M22 [Bacillota bacterium]